MNGNQLTAIITTLNESANIDRCLAQLQWIEDVLVIDSGSEDDTCSRVMNWPNTRLIYREFDSHKGQWDFAISQTNVRTPWILALDADFILSESLVTELQQLGDDSVVDAYRVDITYCIEGRSIRGSIYPSLLALYRPECGRYEQDGHAHRWLCDGREKALRSVIFHDDRKPLARWLANQGRYARLEAEKLRASSWASLRWSGRVRRLGFVAPWLVPLMTLLRGAILSGRAGWVYALQRGIAESLIACYLFGSSDCQADAIDSTASR
ncbi:glycosyltransferase family 2 protein [Gammaproteobacteria bacterium]|nr:glycosyltransferase family 2 protein [Gammaproteobacteria bacterium]